ncbi:MAG: acyl--CoA ligase, partial [Acidobacteria bacterium]|nr:acyl--CoA ligase [Acidobacteriota bacterium]
MRAIDYIEKAIAVHADRVALIDGDLRITYRELGTQVRQIAQGMRALGLEGEQTAGIYSHNHARVLLSMLGIMQAGAVWVPINYRNALEANIEYMKYADLVWLFYHSEFRETVAEIKSHVTSLKHCICLDGDDGDHPSFDTLMKLGEQGDDYDWGDPYGNIDRLVGLVPTGGTTGPAKGVQVTSLAWGTMTELAFQH